MFHTLEHIYTLFAQVNKRWLFPSLLLTEVSGLFSIISTHGSVKNWMKMKMCTLGYQCVSTVFTRVVIPQMLGVFNVFFCFLNACIFTFLISVGAAGYSSAADRFKRKAETGTGAFIWCKQWCLVLGLAVIQHDASGSLMYYTATRRNDVTFESVVHSDGLELSMSITATDSNELGRAQRTDWR